MCFDTASSYLENRDQSQKELSEARDRAHSCNFEPFFRLSDVQHGVISHMSGNNCALKIHKDVFKFAMNDIVNLIFIKLDE